MFDDVTINLGNGYSKSNGVFTCPNNGHYFFMTSLMSGPTNKISAEIVVDGVAKAGVFSQSGIINCSIFLLVHYVNVTVLMKSLYYILDRELPGFLPKIKRIHHWCSVGTGKSQPEGPPFQWETRLRRVSHWNGGPEGWDFPVPLYTNDRFYFSHI